MATGTQARDWYEACDGWMLSGATYSYQDALRQAWEWSQKLGARCSVVNVHPGWTPAMYTVYTTRQPRTEDK